MRNIENELKNINLKDLKMKNFDDEHAAFEKLFKKLFKFVLIFIAGCIAATLLFWGATAYLVVTKGPETVQRVERAVDAYTDKLEQENKKSE